MRRLMQVAAVLCVLMMVMPLAAMPFDVPDAAQEFRDMADTPSLVTGEGVLNDAFADDFESWLNDHFGWREQMIGLFARLNVYGLQTSPSDEVIMGKEGMLFYAETLPDYTGTGALTGEELAQMRRTLSLLSQSLSQRGAHLYVAIVPGKNAIYPQFMPARYGQPRPASNADRLQEATRDLPITWIDLAGVLSQGDELLYYKTDTHWNPLGAYRAAEAIGTAATLDALPKISRIERQTYVDGDLARMMGLGEQIGEQAPVVYTDASLPDADFSLHLVRAQGRGERQLLMLRDSFGTGIAPYITSAYDRSVVRWQTPLEATDDCDDVLLLIAERNLRLYLMDDPIVWSPTVDEGAMPAFAGATEIIDVAVDGYLEGDRLTLDIMTGEYACANVYVQMGDDTLIASQIHQEDGPSYFSALLDGALYQADDEVTFLAQLADGTLRASAPMPLKGVAEDWPIENGDELDEDEADDEDDEDDDLEELRRLRDEMRGEGD